MKPGVEPVAIVGVGAVGPHGFDWRGLSKSEAPRPAATPRLPQVPALSVPEIPQALKYWPSKQERLMSRGAQLAALAMHSALRDAGWESDRERLGCYVGVGAGDAIVPELEALLEGTLADGKLSLKRLAERGPKLVNPLATFRLMHNMTLCHGAIANGLGGPNAAFLSRSAGTLGALQWAHQAITGGRCDRALAGGADSLLNPIVWADLVRNKRALHEVVPSEGAGVLALASRGTPLAWLAQCAARDVPREDVAREARALATDHDAFLVVTPFGELRRELMGLDADVVDLTANLGEAMAASPALACAAAVDLLQAGKARRCLVVSYGVDQQLITASLGKERPVSKAAVRPTAGRPRPVITGVGAVSAFGVGMEPLVAGLSQGRGAISPIHSFDASSSPVRVAGEVPVSAIDASWLEGHLSHCGSTEDWQRRGILRDRKSVFAVLAADEAWRSARCGDSERHATLLLALGLEQTWLEDFVPCFDGTRLDWKLEQSVDLPGIRLRSPVELGLDCVASHLELRGPRFAHASACAAGAMAVAHAASLIETGATEVVLCGGADSMVNPLGVGGFWSLGAPSRRAAPDACRPFDVSRDGLVIGEGAAVFVIEREDRALARGATIQARVLGWGSSQDAYRPTAPRPDGAAAARAIREALSHGALDPTAIGWINAHGTGTPLNDPAEVRAIRAALGSAAEAVPISSIKGAIGHLMAASGAVELASCLLPFSRGVIAGTANLREPDPQCDLDIVRPTPRRAAPEIVLSNSFGFGGQNVCVALGAPP